MIMTITTLQQLKRDDLCDMSIVDEQEYESNKDNKDIHVIKYEDELQHVVYKKYTLGNHSVEELILHYQIKAYNCLHTIENILLFFLGIFIIGLLIMLASIFN